MSAWKNRETGRRGRARVETRSQFDERHYDDEFDMRSMRRSSRSERPDTRIERLTRTATSIGGDRARYSENEGDLEAVADELDRLLSTGDSAPRKRYERMREESGVDQPRARTRKSLPKRDSRSRTSPDEDHLGQVIGALERLDRKVQSLSSDNEPLRDRPQAGRNTRQRVEDDQYFDDKYHEDHLGPMDDYESASDYDDHDDQHDAGYDDEPRRRARPRSERRREHSSDHFYKDLGRRIDSLRRPQEEAFDLVREELGSLRSDLGGISQGTQQKVSRQNAELRRLSSMVERLRTDKVDDQFAREIRREVSELKSIVGQTNVEGALQTLEHGYAHILQRLDELSRSTIDPRVMRGVTVRLNEIEDAFAALPRSEQMIVLEQRVVEISERMEELLQRKGHAEIEPLRSELQDVRRFVEQIDVSAILDGIDDRMKFVSGRLDDLELLAREQRGLDTRLSAVEDRMPAPEVLGRLQGRLEDIAGMMSDDRAAGPGPEYLGNVDSQLDDIVGRLDRMERTPPQAPEAFSALEDRLETITAKIEAIEEKTNRPAPAVDAGLINSAGRAETELLSQLQSRLNDLSEQLEKPSDTVTTSDLDQLRQEIGAMRESVATPAPTDALEMRISDLAQAVERSSSGGLDDTRLEQLGSKVAALAEQLETSSNREDDMTHLASALERIESGLHETQRNVVGIAQKAALEAVSARPDGRSGGYDDAINGLQADLKRLLDAAEGSEERTRNTFDGVQSVLGSVTERLENLERTGSPVSIAAAIADEDSAQAVNRSSALRTELRQDSDPDPDRPAERTRDRKADFIAAARRAAQAASAEAAELDAKSPRSFFTKSEPLGKERASWLRKVLNRGKKPAEDASGTETVSDDAVEREDVIYASGPDNILAGDRPAPEDAPATGGGRGRRRALLFAAAAVVLAIGTLQIFKMATAPTVDNKQIAEVTESQTLAPAPSDLVAEDTNSTVASGERQNDAAEATPSLVSAEQPRAPAPQLVEAAQAPVVSEDVKSTGPVSLPETKAPIAQMTPPSTSPVPPPAAAVPAQAGPELAFAPPTGASTKFSADVSGPAESFETRVPSPAAPATEGALPASLITNLPPEAVGSIALRSAAASGNSAAEFLVGVKYTEGGTIAADLTEAAKWYQKAADKGLAPAQYRLASLYEKGRGVEKDIPKAKDWYIRASEAGNAKAMHNLAVLYAEGAGGTPDFKDAAKWFEAAANFGVKDSLFNLGILYARGLGVEKDLAASYKWFAIAAEQGDRDAAKKRDDVANSMDQATLAAARLMVENFKIQTPLPGANKVVTDPEWATSPTQATKASTGVGPIVDYESMVLEAQTQLNKLGFDTGTPDGQMGPRTRSAISAFQRSLGLTETGSVDAALLKELNGQSI